MATDPKGDPIRGYWELVSDKLRREPALLAVARENIRRWRAQGQPAPNRLDEWEQLLASAEAGAAGFRHLLDVLGSQDPGHARLREFNPFPGVLTREERRRARELCGYRH